MTHTPIDLGPLEADFTAMHADLDRIAQSRLSLSGGELEALAKLFQDQSEAHPEAEAELGTKFQRALVGILEESASADMHGNVGFNVDQASLMSHGAPVLQEAVTMLQDTVQTLVNDLTKAAGAPAPAPAEKGGPALKVDFASMFAGLLKSAIQPPKKG